MRHQPPIVVVLLVSLLAPAVASAASPASSWFGFRPRDVPVTLTSQPPGAQVHLVAPDGTRRSLGSTLAPLVVSLPPGNHRFLFELTGFEPLSRVESLTTGSATIEAVLQRGTTRRFTIPVGLHTIVYERGPDGTTRILPSTLTTAAASAEPRTRPAPDWARVHTPLPSQAQLARATLGPTTADTFFDRYRFLEQSVWASGYAALGCSVTEKDVFVLETLFQLNPKKACLRLDAALAALRDAMARER